MTSTTSDPSDQASVEPVEALTALREHFRASSGSIVASFERYAAQLSAMPTSPRALEALKVELHRVTGTAGGYRLVDASALPMKLKDSATTWSRDAELDRDNRATIVSHFATALRLAFQPPVEAGQLPPLTIARRRRMRLLSVSERTRATLAEGATRC